MTLPPKTLSATSATPNRLGHVWALLAAAVVTLVATPLADHIALANIVMLYLLAVVGIAFRFGTGPAVTASLANVAALDFFLVPPRYSFAVADIQYLLTFAVMLVTGLLIAELSARLRREALAAALREQQSRDLYELARLLSGAIADSQIVEAVDAFFRDSFAARVWLMLRDREGKLAVADATIAPRGFDISVALRVFESTVATSPTAITQVGALLYIPLAAPMRIRGVMLVQPATNEPFNNAGRRQQLETVAVLVAIALERVHFVTVAREATVQMEGERLRNALLAALSHDLRTPLTAVLGLTESLQLGAAGLTAEQAALIAGIHEQARRTNELVENILDMARLESGDIHLRRDWQSLEEIIGSAIKERAAALAAHHVMVELLPELPLVDCDAALMQRVFVNLLENAAKYTPAGSEIRINAREASGMVRVDVVDNGKGVPAGQEQAIFGKFARAEPQSAVPGLGLGLAICRTVIEAHGGKIWVESAPAGGADFAFTLPLGVPPAVELDLREPA